MIRLSVRYRLILPVLLAPLLALPISAEEKPEANPTLWQGAIHLGDDPGRYEGTASAGMAMQVPFSPPAVKQGKLLIVAKDVQTQLGDGHYVEVIAVYQGEFGKEPAREVLVESFRLKDKADEADTEYFYTFDLGRGLTGVSPDYYAVRIKVDTAIGYTLWDDFLIKRVELRP